MQKKFRYKSITKRLFLLFVLFSCSFGDSDDKRIGLVLCGGSATGLAHIGVLKVLEEARTVYENRMIRIPTARLNEEMLPLIEAYPPPSNKGKYIKIKYCTQLPNTQVPSFVFFANLPQYVKEPYKRFLENKIREKWNLSGTPINIFIRQK